VDNKASVRALYEAFGRGDADTVLGSLAAGVDWREAAQMSRILG
jgi:ketosteroid isomerase-like protein